MRIIGGSLKGREFKAPFGKTTHPMSERMRGAMFNALGELNGLTVFDAYGGSGALSFEAVSRGADTVYITDNDKKAGKVIAENINNLGLENEVKFSQANCMTWVKIADKSFDVILADPPYDLMNVNHLNTLVEYLNASGIMVVSSSGRAETPRVDGVVVVKHRTYANAALTFFRID